MIATVIGRYFAMDRDNRWERVEQAYKLIFLGEGTYVADPVAAVRNEYTIKKTDEFMPALVCVQEPRPLIAAGDGILFFNFRGDRARELSQVILHGDFHGFPRPYHPKVSYLTMTQYDATFDAPMMFGPQSMDHLLGQVVAAAGRRQLRMAETEKYPHVTYFFNGGVEAPNPGEDRDMVPSPKVATYDLQPEMSAGPLTDEVLRKLDTGKYDLLILNFANPDMVGHTGVLEAAIKAVETIDACLKRVVEKNPWSGRRVFDHGRSRQLRARDQSRRHAEHRAHDKPGRVHLRRPDRRQGRIAGRHPRRCRADIALPHGNSPAAGDDRAQLGDV